MFNPNPDFMISNPGVGAAIGNAANRHFENSQCNLGGCGSFSSPVPSGPPYGFPQITRGYATDMKLAPERLVNY